MIRSKVWLKEIAVENHEWVKENLEVKECRSQKAKWVIFMDIEITKNDEQSGKTERTDKQWSA